MCEADRFLPDFQRTLKERFSFSVAALVTVQNAKLLRPVARSDRESTGYSDPWQHRNHRREHSFPNLQAAPQEQLSLLITPWSRYRTAKLLESGRSPAGWGRTPLPDSQALR